MTSFGEVGPSVMYVEMNAR